MSNEWHLYKLVYDSISFLYESRGSIQMVIHTILCEEK